MKLRKISITTKYILAVCVMLLTINIIYGFLIMSQSGNAMKTLIRRHMISLAETAAAMINGDELKTLTADDVGSETFHRISDTLIEIQHAQNDVDIKYIYLVKREGDHYVYTVDPDPEEPAEFGEEVVDTPMQDIAWAGTPAIDPEPVEDEWGNYYTVWSPIKDSSATTVGMVGIDFSADWYNQQMSENTITLLMLGVVSLAISLFVMSIFTLQFHNRIQQLDKELSLLSGSVENLVQAIGRQSGSADSDEDDTDSSASRGSDADYSASSASKGFAADHSASAESNESDSNVSDAAFNGDFILLLSDKIHTTQEQLTEYMRYLEKQSLTDDMTGLANRDAYLKRIKEINHNIEKGKASFSVVVFDINGLKYTNDNFGHECGDQMIIDLAEQVSKVFDKEQVYRFGGDEFIVVTDSMDEDDINDRLLRLSKAVARLNQEGRECNIALSFSHGYAIYIPGEDSSYKEVFKRADMAMYKNKGEYYDEKRLL